MTGEPVLATPVRQHHDEHADRQQANRAVAVSAVGLGVTGIIELALALVTGSVALLGDALHNLSDVSTSAVVFLGFRISKKGPSPSYAYGYERAEDLAGLGVALVIWASAVFAGYESYRKLVGNTGTSHLAIGMAGAVLGVIGNQVVARYKMDVGRRINSVTLVADAKHSWLDAISSLGALAGLVLVALGYRWGDPIAGFAVTGFILHVGYSVTKEILFHLMDGGDPNEIEVARRATDAMEGVRSTAVRGRWMGRSLLLEIEAELQADVTLARADKIGADVYAAVLRAVPAARQILWVPRGPGEIASGSSTAGAAHQPAGASTRTNQL